MGTRLCLPNELDSQKKKQGTKPKEREKKVWPNSYQTKSYAAQSKEYPTIFSRNHPRKCVPVFKRLCEPGKGGQPFIGAQYRRKHSRKRDRSIEGIFEVGCCWHIHVMPIIHVLVEIFKEPPKASTKKKEFTKKPWAMSKKALAGTLIGEGIQYGDIAKPE